MRPIFCGNFDYETRQSDLERLFRKYGRVDRVDMKSGFAFIYMDSDRDADDAIRALDRIDFGRSGRRLRVEWTKQERGIRMPGGSRGSAVNSRPSKTLFVINFDPYNTKARDLERHFEPYGKIVNVRIRRNFAFIQFESQEDATKALSAANMSKLMDRVISVEYAIRDDDDRGNRYSRDRSRDRSPERRAYDKGRSLSPYRRERGSPDYGRGPSPNNYGRERGSPDYGRGPSPGARRRQKASPDYGRGYSRSPRRGERASDDYGRGPIPSPHRRERFDDDYGHGSSHSSHRREKAGADYGHGHSQISPQKEKGGYCHSPSPSPQRRERAINEYERGSARSPVRENSVPPNDRRNRLSPSPRKRIKHDNGPSPRREKDPDDYGRELSMSPPGKERAGNGYDGESSPFEREKINLDQENGAGPNSKHELRDSPNSGGDDSPMHEGYRSP